MKLNGQFSGVKDMIEYPKDEILSKELYNDKIEITLFCMTKGTEMSEHTSTRNGVVFVLEGKGVFNLENEKIEMNDGVIIFMKKNAVHSLKVEENTSFLLFLS